MKKFITCSLLSVLLLSSVPTRVHASEEIRNPLVPRSLKLQEVSAVTPDSFKLGVDDYVTGTLDKSIRKVILYVNGIKIRAGKVFKDQSFEVQASDVIHSLNDIVEVVGLNKSGVEIDRQKVLLESEHILFSAEDFILYDESIKGTAGNKMDLVSLMVNDQWIRSVEISMDDSFEMPIEDDDIFDEDDVVELVGSLAGKELARITVPINPIDLQAVIQEFNFGIDPTIRGKVTGKAAKNGKKAQLYVNRKRYTIVAIQADGTFEFNISRYITSEKDEVKIAILNQKEIEIGRYQVAFKQDNNNENGENNNNGESGNDENENGNEELPISAKKPLKDWFEDITVAQSVANQLGCDVDFLVSQEDFLSIEEISMDNFSWPLITLNGLEFLKNLKLLNLYWINKEADLTNLAKMTKLENLHMFESQLTDSTINLIGTLINLKNLSLYDCNLKNIQPISNLTNLESLNFSRNAINDITPLANLKKLTYISGDSNAIQDISILDLEQIEGPINWSFGSQTITLQRQKLSDNGRLILPMPIKENNGNTVEPNSISNGGIYENQQITWQLNNSLGKTTFSFFEQILDEKKNIFFSGNVTVPYNK